MPTSRFQRIFILAGIIALFIAYIALWIRFINDPVERTGSDFIAFYSAGRVAQEYGYSRVFIPELQQAVQQEVVGFPLVEGQVLLLNHPPLLPPILRLLMTEDYVQSFHRWAILLLVIYAISLFTLNKALEVSGIERGNRVVIAITSFLFLPLFFSLMNGQDTPIVLLGVAIWFYGLVTGKEWTAGLGLSLTVMRPHLSLAFAIPMMFSHRKALIGYALGSAALVLLSVLIIGVDGMQRYISILSISASGEWHGMNEVSMVNLLGLVLRIFGESAVQFFRTGSWILFAVCIAVLTFLWSRKKGLQDNLLGLSVVLVLLLSPHLHFHDLTLLLVPFYELVRTGYLKNFAATASPIAASLLLFVSNISPALQFTMPYFLMLALAVYPYIANREPILIEPHRS